MKRLRFSKINVKVNVEIYLYYLNKSVTVLTTWAMRYKPNFINICFNKTEEIHTVLKF